MLKRCVVVPFLLNLVRKVRLKKDGVNLLKDMILIQRVEVKVKLRFTKILQKFSLKLFVITIL